MTSHTVINIGLGKRPTISESMIYHPLTGALCIRRLEEAEKQRKHEEERKQKELKQQQKLEDT